MEALLRLAYKIMNIWPMSESDRAASISLSSGLLKRESMGSISSDGGSIGDSVERGLSLASSSIASGGVSGGDRNGGGGGIKDTDKGDKGGGGGILPLKASNVQKSSHETDPSFASAHKSLRCICELLLMALRDRDTPGLRYLFQERKRKESEHLAKLQRQHVNASHAHATAVATAVAAGGTAAAGGVTGTSSAATTAANTTAADGGETDNVPNITTVLPPPITTTPNVGLPTEDGKNHIEIDEVENMRQSLFALELITGQAVHIQRTSNKSSNGQIGSNQTSATNGNVDHVTPRGKTSSGIQTTDNAAINAFKEQD